MAAPPERRAISVDDWRTFAPLDLTPILTGALEAFREHGYHGTTVRDIAGRVGVTVPALYYHHTNKQAMLLALLDLAMEELIPRVHAAVEDAGDRPDRRFAHLTEAIALHLTHRADLAVLDSELRYLEPGNRAHYAARRGEVQRLLVDILETGTAEGVFDVAHIPDTARALLGMHQAIVTWYRPGKGLSPEQIAERYVDISLRAVGVRRGPAPAARKGAAGRARGRTSS